MSSFSGISTALTALHANRRGMEVASQNIANANTVGYTRQRADLQAIGGAVYPGIHAQASGPGSGVDVASVSRLQNTFLENRGRIEHAQTEYLAGRSEMLGQVELAFAEPSDTALQSQMSEMWDSFSDLSNRPGESSARTAVLQRAGVVAETLHSMSGQLGSLWESTREGVDATVTDVNTMAGTVAQLNKAIVAAQAGGQPANELADQRDQLVMRLSELTGARGINRDDGSVDVNLGGSSLVFGSTARELKVEGATRMADQAGTPVQLKWVDNDAVAAAPSGRLAASMESLGTTLPGYQTKLDDVAKSIRDTVNTQHKKGFDLNGVAGKDLFSGTGAADLKVAITATDELAASGSATNKLDGANADLLGDLSSAASGPDQQYRQVVVDLGVETQSINRRLSIQQSVSQDVDAARLGEAGVSLDEEMTNMVALERAYQAAAKVISTIDSMMDTLINRLGA